MLDVGEGLQGLCRGGGFDVGVLDKRGEGGGGGGTNTQKLHLVLIYYSSSPSSSSPSPPPPSAPPTGGTASREWRVGEVGEAQTRAVLYGVGCWRTAIKL